ncbi:uncharacterized protein LOC143768604 [Ranitomeya variabilis]|uniref:uncharacterized protein LOC143768604 n=1 Tax=Ranitomeya variabilis TaxID=490064 RepID=UPI004055FAA4
MPISSGAEGHVGLGVDRSIKWIPEGGEDYQAVRISNSYLQRHLNQYGGQEKIKKENMIMRKSQSPQRTHDMQNGVHTNKDADITEQRRSKKSKVQDSPKKETNAIIYPSNNSRKMGKEDSHADANTHMTSTQQAEKKDMSITNSPAKKSKACVLL